MTEDWKCCMCPTHRADQHEELWSFGPYGDNVAKKEDCLAGNEYCREHFEQKEQMLNYPNNTSLNTEII